MSGQIQLPDECGNGHQGLIWAQRSWCPQCGRPTVVLRCNKNFDMGCHWEAATDEHYASECTPDAPVYKGSPVARGPA